MGALGRGTQSQRGDAGGCLWMNLTSNASEQSVPRVRSSQTRPPGCRLRYGSRSYSSPWIYAEGHELGEVSSWVSDGHNNNN